VHNEFYESSSWLAGPRLVEVGGSKWFDQGLTADENPLVDIPGTTFCQVIHKYMICRHDSAAFGLSLPKPDHH
jgi:hypothetical protein